MTVWGYPKGHRRSSHMVQTGNFSEALAALFQIIFLTPNSVYHL